MQKLSIITALLIASFSAAYPETGREKVLIFNITIRYEKSVLVDRKKKGKEERFDYYSFIIPHTIAKNLNASGKIEARKIDGELPLSNIGSDDFYARMAAVAAQHSAGYLLGGKGTIRGKKMTLELALVDIRRKDFTAITKETFETGAEMRNIISDISADIEQKLAIAIKEARPPEKEEALPPEEEKEEITPVEKETEIPPAPAQKEQEGAPADKEKETGPEPVPVSPFLKMYRALDGLSFGIKAGSFFIKGPFTKLYEDSEYVSPYLRYGILSWLGVSAEADYIAADNGDIQVRKLTSLALWGVTLNADFTWWMFSRVGLRLAAGAGISHGRLYLWGSDNPFGGLNKQAKSTDPYLNISASALVRFNPVELQFGGAYKSAFFRGRTLSLLTVFFGIGYQL